MPLSAKAVFSKPKAPSSFPSSDFIPRFTPSQGALVCGGCVIIDPTLRKVAFIHDPSTGINQLPKGRKNIGEDIHAAALREAREETGLHVAPLPLKGLTRATPTAQMLGQLVHEEGVAADAAGEDEEGGDVWEDVDEEGTNTERASGLTGWAHHCEPIGITTYRCETTLAFKIIFWYAAQADSLEDPRRDTKERWEQQYELKWVDAKRASTHTTFKADGQAMEKALADMRRSGYEI
ncbi:NUDIX domain-containing protein [Metarhizium acridum CQMa 102]|uniref:NUDIX domain-containing protein n=1 Tax=Metarhizium acridum (strain CQMa 102) TaxID=655827 RepID=E9EFS2_METAQ|nr:NUDIX domain-containing protein [Metarhizium acridum CQMa 102]EFY85260.1 NUDIX domain-containing protein [Metarhizium acridum CQMa 102]